MDTLSAKYSMRIRAQEPLASFIVSVPWRCALNLPLLRCQKTSPFVNLKLLVPSVGTSSQSIVAAFTEPARTAATAAATTASVASFTMRGMRDIGFVPSCGDVGLGASAENPKLGRARPAL